MDKVAKAKISDVPQMHKLINHFAGRGEMLARPLSEIYENIRDYFVVIRNNEVVGCAALHIMWEDLAEIKSVAVHSDSQKLGIGSLLVKACIKEAHDMEIPTIFCLTYRPDFFGKFGLSEVDKMELPQKIWTECYHCPKFPDCDEIAMTAEMAEVYSD